MSEDEVTRAVPLTLPEARGMLHDLSAAGWSDAFLDRLIAALSGVPEGEASALCGATQQSETWGASWCVAALHPVPSPEPLDVERLTAFLAAAALHEGSHGNFPSIRAQAEWMVSEWRDPKSLTNLRLATPQPVPEDET